MGTIFGTVTGITFVIMLIGFFVMDRIVKNSPIEEEPNNFRLVSGIGIEEYGESLEQALDDGYLLDPYSYKEEFTTEGTLMSCKAYKL
jgi:hypothetical protein